MMCFSCGSHHPNQESAYLCIFLQFDSAKLNTTNKISAVCTRIVELTDATIVCQLPYIPSHVSMSRSSEDASYMNMLMVAEGMFMLAVNHRHF